MNTQWLYQTLEGIYCLIRYVGPYLVLFWALRYRPISEGKIRKLLSIVIAATAFLLIHDLLSYRGTGDDAPTFDGYDRD